MHRDSSKAAWVQGALLAAAIVAIALTLVFRLQRPFDRDTLAIQVAQLQSDAAEAQLLVDNARADRLAPGFVRQHAWQMADKVDTTNGKLQKAAQRGFDAEKSRAQRIGAALYRSLLRLGRDGTAREAFGFDVMADALDGLHKQLKPAD